MTFLSSLVHIFAWPGVVSSAERRQSCALTFSYQVSGLYIVLFLVPNSGGDFGFLSAPAGPFSFPVCAAVTCGSVGDLRRLPPPYGHGFLYHVLVFVCSEALHTGLLSQEGSRSTQEPRTGLASSSFKGVGTGGCNPPSSADRNLARLPRWLHRDLVLE